MSTQPYIGLRPFEREETDIFFGREQHSDELIDRLGSSHFLAVIGPSGCGKSSLVKTGLIAGLEAGFLATAGTHWRIVEMRPGNQPFKELADKLFSELNGILTPYYTAETLQYALRQGSLSLHELLARHPLPNNAQLLIVCDQFEEIFRYLQQGSTAEARNFVSLLLASSKPYPLSATHLLHSAYIVITMRSDFLGDCAKFAGLAEAINQGLYLTPRLDTQQLRAAIEEPAFVFEGEIEPALVTQLLEDAQNNQDQLPLLQHVLMRLWDLATDKSAALTLADYEAMGGLANALSRHADEVYDGLTNDQKRIAEIMFRSLTERGDIKRDTRRPVKLAKIIELTSAPFAEVVTVIDAFRHAGRCFLMPPINVAISDNSIIDISHESLIRQWQRLKAWTKDEAESAKTYQRLEDRAIQWEKHKTSLLQSPELEIFQQWWQEKKPNKLWAKRYGKDFALTEKFVQASEQSYQQYLYNKEKSQKHKEKRQRQLLILSAIIITGLVGIIALLFFGYKHEHEVYCNTFIKRFGVAQCYGQLTSSQVKNRAVSIKLISKGQRNPVYKIQAVDSSDKITPNNNIGSYLKAVDFNTFNTITKESQWEFEYDKEGNVIYEKSYNKEGQLIWGLIYLPRKDTLSAKAFFVGANGYPQAQNKSKAEFVEFKYSTKGDEIEMRYFDRYHNPQIGLDKAYGQRKEFDINGLVTKITSLNPQGLPMNDIEGNSGMEIKYDKSGNAIEAVAFDEKGKPVLIKDGWYKTTVKYDSNGNQIERDFFDVNGNPTLCKDGYHKLTTKYDDRGNQIEWAVFDALGQPTLEKTTNSHKITSQYDINGNKIEVSYFDVLGQSSLHKDGYHKITSQYDDRGNQIESAYFDVAGQPTTDQTDDTHKTTYKYDDRGNLIESAYFGVNGQATLHKDGNHKYTAKYDDRGNQIEWAYFDVNGNATLNKEGYHKSTANYDDRGNLIELAYFDAVNQPTIDLTKNTHKTTYNYDDRGNQIASAYFDVNGKEALYKDGYHKRTKKYDEKGNLLEEAYFGLENKPVFYNNSDGSQYHKLTRKYDEKSNIIEFAYFGLNDEPVLGKNSYYKMTAKYDEKGNLIEAAFYGLKNEAVLYKDSDGNQYHKLTKKYDERGNQIEWAIFGLNDEPILGK